jgi:hypothetical protein
MDEEELDWPPPEARVRAALWRGTGHLERREYAAASRALVEVVELVPEDELELLRGLHHLAAAGYKAQAGDRARAGRQLAHARRRLAPYLPAQGEIDLTVLVELVERDLRS